ncbi:MAG: MATE family efflux transporter [Flavobacteriaceae bacterium]|jgi:O-antigen/teichoic acid export membrane protein|uniref:Polysaccharide biosynthesis protein C-terminal domain-containing protein n=1 Tax=marine metagenome TaxID=408172 RepID=A0A381NBD2_9ZZZZ|nr:MATE family efflux transporter [Flavobacteriaceae bacterium]|tara:strand:- start:3758 stop:5038 length:1281 start_codon:yes stop_codon:yes gene_type:complete
MTKNGLIQKSIKVLFLRGSGVVLLFLFTMFLTNYYSAELVGKYDFVRSTIMILSGVSLIGTNQAIIYYSGFLKSKNSLESIKNIYVKMLMMTTALCLLFILGYAMLPEEFINELFNKQEAHSLILKSIAALFFYTTTMLNIDTLRALNKTISSELYRNIFRYTPIFIFSIILYYTQNQEWLIEAFLASFLLLSLTTLIQVGLLFKKLNLPKNNDYNFSYHQIFARSYPMALSAIAYFIMQSVDIIILTAYEGFESIAYYSVAVKLATVTALALMSVNIVVAPKIAEIYSTNDFEKLNKLINDSARIIFVISIPVLIILFVFSDFMLGLFGENYVLAREALLLLLGGQFFSSLCGPGAVYLNMTGKQKKLNTILILGLGINVILNLALIPAYGIEGAAVATLISMIFWNSLIVAVIYSTDRIKIFIS